MCRRTYIQPIELLNISSAWIWRGVRAKYVEHEAVLIFQLNFVQESPAESLGRIWIAFDWLSDWCWVISHDFHPNITKFSCFSSLEVFFNNFFCIQAISVRRHIFPPCAEVKRNVFGFCDWEKYLDDSFNPIRVKYVKRLIQTNTTTWFVICEPWN